MILDDQERAAGHRLVGATTPAVRLPCLPGAGRQRHLDGKDRSGPRARADVDRDPEQIAQTLHQRGSGGGGVGREEEKERGGGRGGVDSNGGGM